MHANKAKGQRNQAQKRPGHIHRSTREALKMENHPKTKRGLLGIRLSVEGNRIRAAA